MMCRFQRLVTLAALLVVACGVARAGWIEEREDRTVIHLKLFEVPDPSRREANIRADATVVREFIRTFPERFEKTRRKTYEANPDKYGQHTWKRVEVELHPYSGIKIEGLGDRIGMGNLLSIAGGVAPDVMYVNFRQSGTYIREGFLYPLDKPEDGYLTAMSSDALRFRIHPKIEPVIRRTGPDGKEHVWALPYGGALGKVVVYDKRLFDDAKVPYPRNEWTWDDLLTAAKTIHNPGKGIYGIWLSASKHEAAYWLTFLWSAGGDVFTQAGPDAPWRAVFDSAEAAVALDFYTRLCTEPWTDAAGKARSGYACREAGSLAAARWKRGEIAMRLDYIDERLFSQVDPEVTGLVPVPIGPTGVRAAELNSRMMGLFAGIQDPAVRDAAWDYIRFFDSREAAAIKTRIMVESGYGRFLNPDHLKAFGYEDVIRLSPRGWADCFRIAIATGRPEPYVRNCNAIYEIMTDPIREAEELGLEGRLPTEPAARQQLLCDMLGRAARRAEEEMLGVVPTAVKTKRRATAAVMLLCIGMGAVWVVRRVSKAFAPPPVVGHVQELWGFRRYAPAYLIMLPAVLCILFWQYIPLLRGSIMAFQDYKVMGDSEWVWLDNFGSVLWSRAWWISVWNSLRYSFLVIALTFIPPLILAILLQEIPRGRMLFRTLYYLPAMIAGLVTILLWKMFYDGTEHGALNALVMRIPAGAYLLVGLLLLGAAGLFARRLQHYGKTRTAWLFLVGGGLVCYTFVALAQPVMVRAGGSLLHQLLATAARPTDWLRDSDTAMFCCVLPMVWAGIGPGCLIYLAALKSISDELYEVADMEGATFVDKVLFIVFPMLKPLLIINFVGVFIGSWKATANILAMTGGRAGTEVAGLHIFFQSFMHLRFGPATAMAWVLGFILIGFTVNQLRILSRMEFRTTGEE